METEDRHLIAKQISYDTAVKMLNVYKDLIEADFTPLAKAQAYVSMRKIGRNAAIQLHNAGFTNDEAMELIEGTARSVEEVKFKLL